MDEELDGSRELHEISVNGGFTIAQERRRADYPGELVGTFLRK
jgi:chemotaxis response regulator CheB